MKLSIIVPAYNEEKFIAACIEHILRASAGFDCELIVVDNASTDRTPEIAQRFPAARVLTEKRKGVQRARQCGYENATGDLIAYVDADTQMPEKWVATVFKEFEKNPNLACLSGPYVYYDLPLWKDIFVWIYFYFGAFPIYLVTRHMAIAGNVIVRRSTLEKMGGLDTTIEFYGDDTNLSRRASAFGKVKFKLGLVMKTSGRRLTDQGFAKTAYLYVLNFLSEIFRHKPATKEYEDFR